MDMDRRAQYDDSRPSGRDAREAGLRAADTDRAATAALLERHYTAGRLETQEFEERVGRSYAAKTMGELHDVVVDLPRISALASEPDSGRARHYPVGRLVMVVPLVLALAAVAGLTGAHVMWLVWPPAFFILRAGLWRGRRGWGW
jgi:uncharacterized protein DUF1707